MIKKLKKYNKGFSLAEMLIVVAIMIILMGVSFVSVMTYLRSLKLTEYDHTAQEIFVAAQYHLSVAKTNGSLDSMVSDNKTEELGIVDTLYHGSWYEKDLSAGENIRTIVYSPSADEDDIMGKKALDTILLPDGAIEETIRSNGSYIITYDYESANIVGVFYSGAADQLTDARYQYDFYDTDAYDLKQDLLREAMSSSDGKIENSMDQRKHFDDNKIIGFYGGQDYELIAGSRVGDKPLLRMENGDTLRALVTVNKDAAAKIKQKTHTIRLTIHGKTSDAKAIIYLNDFNHHGIFTTTDSVVLKGNATYTFILDNVVEANENQTFAQQFWDDGLIPGEDIEVSAAVVDAEPKNDEVYRESVTRTTNSIYASFTGNSVKDDESDRAVITSIRHLENLSANISKIDQTSLSGKTKLHTKKITPKSAIQMEDLSWYNFYDNLKRLENLGFSIDADSLNEKGFEPIRISSSLLYEGNNKKINNLYIIGRTEGRSASDGDAALFGTVGFLQNESSGKVSHVGVTVQNLALNGISVESMANGDGGAIIGTVNRTDGDVVLKNILVYGKTAVIKVNDPGAGHLSTNTGGLIGSYMGQAKSANGHEFTIEQCGVSCIVSGATAAGSNPAVGVGWNDAGGLIGIIRPLGSTAELNDPNVKVTIKESYVGGRTDGGIYREATFRELNPNADSTLLEMSPGWNVQGYHTIGGAIGALFSRYTGFTTVENSYSTASVFANGSDAGGFIGFLDALDEDKSIDGKSLSRDKQEDIARFDTNQPVRTLIKSCYAAGKVGTMAKGTYGGNAGAFIGTLHIGTRNQYWNGQKDPNSKRKMVPSTVQKGIIEDCYYLAVQKKDENAVGKSKDALIALNAFTDSYSTVKEVNDQVAALDAKEMYARAYKKTSNVVAEPFDSTLGKIYPYENWTTVRANTSEKVNTHYGDWIVPSGDKPVAEFNNSDVLQLKLTIKDAKIVKGKLDAQVKLTLFNLEDSTGSDYKMYVFDDGELPKELAKFSTMYQDGNNVIVLMNLDDITTENGHFGQIFSGWTPGIGISATVTKNGINSIAQEGDATYQTITNSVFGDETSNSKIQISNARHLQNLSSSVSKAYSSGNMPTSISLDQSILWSGSSDSLPGQKNFFDKVSEMRLDGSSADKIYLFNGTAITKNAFCAINNAYLGGTFTGGNNAIANLPIVANATSAGLFGTISRNFSVQDLNLENIKTSGQVSYAGALIGNAGKNNVKVDNVHIYGRNTSITSEDIAGGMVGESNAILTAKNSGVTAYVKGSIAGGFIGKSADSVITNCYSGGRTTQGSFEYDAARTKVYNVEGNDVAGGFVGEMNNSKITNSFSSSSVGLAGKTVRGYVGGFVGIATGGEIQNTYAVGVVHGKEGKSGSFAGKLDNIVLEGTNYVLNKLNWNESYSKEMPIVGTSSAEQNNIKSVDDTASEIQGSNSIDRTHPVDETLFGKGYPYKVYGDSSQYYGDWKSVKTVAPWKYKVEYKVRYKGYATDMTVSTSEETSIEEVTSVMFQMPDGYKGFAMSKTDDEDTGIRYVRNADGGNTAVFTIEPNVTKGVSPLRIKDTVAVYDEKPHVADHEVEFEGFEQTLANVQLSYKLYYREWGSKNNNDWTETAPSDPGEYQVNAIAIANIDGKDYVVLDQESEKIKLSINIEWTYKVNYIMRTYSKAYVDALAAAGDDAAKQKEVEESYKDESAKYIDIPMYTTETVSHETDPFDLEIPTGCVLFDPNADIQASYSKKNDAGDHVYDVIVVPDMSTAAIEPTDVTLNAYLLRNKSLKNSDGDGSLVVSVKMANDAELGSVLTNIKPYLIDMTGQPKTYDESDPMQVYQNTKSADYRLVYKVTYTPVNGDAASCAITYLVDEYGNIASDDAGNLLVVPDSQYPTSTGDWMVTGQVVLQKYGLVQEQNDDGTPKTDADGQPVYEKYADGQVIEWRDNAVVWQSGNTNTILHITRQPKTITLNKDRLYIGVGGTGQVTATITEEGEEIQAAVNWSSSNAEIASVDPATGVITGHNLGVVTITASLADGEQATMTVSVQDSAEKASDMNYAWDIQKMLLDSLTKTANGSPVLKFTDENQNTSVDVVIFSTKDAAGSYYNGLTKPSDAESKAANKKLFVDGISKDSGVGTAVVNMLVKYEGLNKSSRARTDIDAYVVTLRADGKTAYYEVPKGKWNTYSAATGSARALDDPGW